MEHDPKNQRKESHNTVHHLSVDNRDVTSHHDIVNALADTFLIIRPVFSTDAFTDVCNKAENQNLNISSENVEVYNRPFRMEELQDTLRTAHDTSAGPDEIHYQLLKHLPKSLLLLLIIYYKICISCDFPLICGKPL